MILAISNSSAYEVECIKAVSDQLRKRGKILVMFYTDKCLEGEYIGYKIIDNQFIPYAVIDRQEINLNEVEEVWYLKPILPKPLRQIQPPEHQIFVRRQFLTMWYSLCEILKDKRWISPHWNVIKAEYKPYQLSIASKVGFEIPKTLITSNPDEVRKFWSNCHREMIIKLLAVSPIEDHVIYANKLSQKDIANINTIRFSSAIFQEYIPKKYELRITVVGDRVFSVKIDSQSHRGTKVDWRRRINKELNLTPAELPRNIENKCIELTKQLGLRFGCIDMIVTPDNHYVFLEINPNGQWWFAQAHTGLPIASTIADLLCGDK